MTIAPADRTARLEELAAVAKAWREGLGDSAEQWLTDEACELVRVIDSLGDR